MFRVLPATHPVEIWTPKLYGAKKLDALELRTQSEVSQGVEPQAMVFFDFLKFDLWFFLGRFPKTGQTPAMRTNQKLVPIYRHIKVSCGLSYAFGPSSLRSVGSLRSTTAWAN